MSRTIWVSKTHIPALVYNKDPRSIIAYEAKVELLGQTFHRLTIQRIEITKRVDTRGYESLRYRAHCQCSCGNPVVAYIENIVTGTTHSCGCQNLEQKQGRRKLDPQAKVLNSRLRTLVQHCETDGTSLDDRWNPKVAGSVAAVANLLADLGAPPTPQHVIGRHESSRPFTKANCAWMTRTEAQAKRRGVAITTGNWTRDDSTYRLEYGRLHAMHQRCYNPKHGAYKTYGAEGITICDRWRFDAQPTPAHAVANFMSDMGPRPSPLHSIERKDGTKGYSPDNCVWATEVEQANNRRTNVVYRYEGAEHTRSQLSRLLARKHGLSAQSIEAKLAGEPTRSAAWINAWCVRRVAAGASIQ